MNILEAKPIAKIRRNHGIEHATVHVLTERDPDIRLIGRADLGGFNIYGDVPTEQLKTATQEALERMKSGQEKLAVHPRCGTQIVVGGVLTGLAAALALGRKPKLSRLPDVIVATTLAALMAQPLGLTVQEKITTSGDVQGARFKGIRKHKFGSVEIQHVDIEWDE